MEQSVRIETPRLVLRRHGEEDYDRFWSMMTDPEAKRFTGGVTTLSYMERRKLFVKESAMELAVAEKIGNRYLGYCGFRLSEELKGWEFLYGYCRDTWGKGYGGEAAKAFLRYLFDAMPHSEYVAAADDANAASVRILTGLGFQRTGTLILEGLGTVNRYVLTRANFANQNSSTGTD